MNSSIAAFLRRKGAVELLCIVDRLDYSGRFTDLDEKINVSHSTLSKRLDEAQELGLVTIAINPQADSPETVYGTTQVGRKLQSEMGKLGLLRMYEKLRNVEELFAEGSEELVAWAEELDRELVEAAENAEIDRSPVDEQIIKHTLEGFESVDER
jgi:DNA-binding HxlR family transcriptional regulator